METTLCYLINVWNGTHLENTHVVAREVQVGVDVAQVGHGPDGPFELQKVQSEFKCTIYKGCVSMVIKITNGIIYFIKRIIIYAKSIHLVGLVLNMPITII